MQITIADYLLSRLKELGIEHVFGIAGDYNLMFLEHIIEDPDLTWIGTCNELNGAYASDGYARVKGASALVTTFGVGELSAINGIAGAYAEYVPVVHIVGIPATSVLENKSLVHHTLGDGRFCVFMDMYKSITVSQILITKDNTAREIDKGLVECWRKKKPIYIGLPSDLVNEKITAPTKALDLTYPPSNQDAINECIERIAKLVTKAKAPIILADLCADRYGMKTLIHSFLDSTGILFATMNMGKGLIDESHPQYLGNYCGEFSSEGVQEKVENSDCVITFGSLMSDLNTGGFSAKLNANVTIEIHSYYTRVKQSIYHDVVFFDLIPALTKRLASYHSSETVKKPVPKPIRPSATLTQAYLWDKIADCLEEDAVILAEAGTSLFGAIQMPLPNGAKFISQTLWGSIGYTLGALLGAKIAAPQRQTLLFIGDGAFQLTAQEVSTIMRHQLNPIIFVLNNAGYTVERLIYGATRSYNDIAQWCYQEFPKSFKGAVHSLQIKTSQELEDVIKQIKSGELNKNRLALIEVFLAKMDAPEALIKIGESMNARNKAAPIGSD